MKVPNQMLKAADVPVGVVPEKVAQVDIEPAGSAVVEIPKGSESCCSCCVGLFDPKSPYYVIKAIDCCHLCTS